MLNNFRRGEVAFFVRGSGNTEHFKSQNSVIAIGDVPKCSHMTLGSLRYDNGRLTWSGLAYEGIQNIVKRIDSLLSQRTNKI